MSTVIIILCVLVAAPLALGLIFFIKSGRARPPGDIGAFEAGMPDTNIHVEIYAFDGEVNSIDDVKAIRIGIYRDTGAFIGYSADGPVFKRRLRPDRAGSEEIAKILDCAKESVRVSAQEILYFFTSVKPLALKSPQAQSVYQCMTRCIKASQSILCTMKSIPAEEDDIDANGQPHGGEAADFDDDGV